MPLLIVKKKKKRAAMDKKELQLQQLLNDETTPKKVPLMCAGSPQSIASGLSIGGNTEAFTAAEDQSNNNDTKTTFHVFSH
jgi:hypothetical protein